MNEDLKIIKKKYGEEMMHFCRESFSTILEEEGKLSQLLLDHFEPNHSLYSDIVTNNLSSSFKAYIFNIYIKVGENLKTNKTPEELLDEAGYILYECKSEEEIQNFKKYYSSGEELCTFRGGRLKKCHVFFAVKKNVDEIKREDFEEPKRQDEYGTSVISIQFTKDDNHTLSIKNRYNHTVQNPDASFSNNLDNIIEGLTDSFEKVYGLNQKFKSNDFEIPGYIEVNQKYYKYNYEINNIYYCSNNIIIDNFKVKHYEKEKYIIMDYFILDLQNKKIYLYNKNISDCFVDNFQSIKDIRVEITLEGRIIYITPEEGEIIEIELDNKNNIIGYKNHNILEINSYYLHYNKCLKRFECPNIKIIKHYFLVNNEELTEIMLPNVTEIGYSFLYRNKKINKVDFSSLIIVEDQFLYNNTALLELKCEELQKIGESFLEENKCLKKLFLPKVVTIGNRFLYCNKALENLGFPLVKSIGHSFMYCNNSLKQFSAPLLESVDCAFLINNMVLETYDLNNLIRCEMYCLEKHPNIKIANIVFPNIRRNNSKKGR